MTSKKTELDFETALQNLEESVAKLKSEGLTLDESIQVYEKCIMYHKRCDEILKNAKQKVEIYLAEYDKIEDFGELS
jgi:exodeoxyribonuclease VII small subunit